MQSTASGPADRPQLSVSIDEFFLRMQGIYDHYWTSRWPTPESLRAAKAEWADGLLGCSAERIQIGIERARRHHKKPPHLPEFIECCLPHLREFGLPDPEAAYREACRWSHAPGAAKWSHPVVYHAGRQVGWFDMQQVLNESQKQFFKIYRALCREAMAGKQFELPRCDGRSLGYDGNATKIRTEQQKQTAQHWLGQMKQALGG